MIKAPKPRYLFKGSLKLRIEPIDAKTSQKEQALLKSVKSLLLNCHRYGKDLKLNQTSLETSQAYIADYFRTKQRPALNYTFSYFDKRTKKLHEVKRVVSGSASLSTRYSIMREVKEMIRYEVTRSRQALRSTKFTESHGTFRRNRLYFSKLGGVHTKPNTYLNIWLQHNRWTVFHEKAPQTLERHVGIELEFISKTDREKLGSMLTSERLFKNVYLKDDGSIRTNDDFRYPHELCILATEKEVEDVIRRVCKVLRLAKCMVNKTCGMHVHLDMRDRNKEKVFANLVAAQPILYQMNPPSRQQAINGNFYCQPTKGKKFNPHMNRYSGINAAAYGRHTTIEVRIHAGTIDYTKIMNWVNILLRIIEADEVKRSPSTFKGFVKKFGLTIEQCEYIVGRVKQFSENANLEEVA